MAQTGYTPIQLYRTATASASPIAGNLSDGELAINTNDGKLFYKDSGGTVQVIASKGAGTVGGSNTYVQYNNNGVLGGSANFVFDGTNVGIGTTSPNLSSSSTALTVNTGTAANYSAIELASGGTLNFYINANNATSYITSSGTRPMVFYTNSSERMRIDSSGNVGIGTSAPGQKLVVAGTGGAATLALLETGVRQWLIRAGGAATNLFDIADYTAGASRLVIDSSGNVGIGTNNPSSGAIVKYLDISNATSAGLVLTAVNKFSIYSSSSSSLVFRDDTAATARMVLDSSGNVGIGTTSPVSVAGYTTLTLNNATSGGAIYLQAAGTSVSGLSATNGGMTIATLTSVPMLFYINSAERMRIDTSGNLLLNTTNSGAAGTTCRFTINDGATYAPFGINNNAAGTAASNVCIFARNGTIVGTISVTGSATSYNPSSDIKLKENIQPITDGIARVMKLKPVTYNWRSDGSYDDGFIAQDLLAVPEFAHRANKIDERDGETYYGVDYMRFVSVLTAALQEAVAKITALEDRITKLESGK